MKKISLGLYGAIIAMVATSNVSADITNLNKAFQTISSQSGPTFSLELDVMNLPTKLAPLVQFFDANIIPAAQRGMILDYDKAVNALANWLRKNPTIKNMIQDNNLRAAFRNYLQRKYAGKLDSGYISFILSRAAQ